MPDPVGKRDPRAYVSQPNKTKSQKADKLRKAASFLGRKFKILNRESKISQVSEKRFPSKADAGTSALPAADKEHMLRLTEKCSMSRVQTLPREELNELRDEVNEYLQSNPDFGGSLKMSLSNIGRVILERSRIEKTIEEKSCYNLNGFEAKQFLDRFAVPGDMLIRES